MADDKLKYSDIIQPDDSIEKLIGQLSELNTQYEGVIASIKTGAERIARALKASSGATDEGRKSINEAAIASARLESAQRELRIALTDTGKQIAWVKAQTSDANKASVEHERYIRQAVSSYDKLKSDLKEYTALYKSLTAAERDDSAMGQQVLQSIINLKNEIKALDNSMKPHIQLLNEVQKAELKLSYLQSEEGQKLLDLKAKIAEIVSARRQQKNAIDPVVQAQEKLAYARSEENQQLKQLSAQTREANQIAELQAQIANSAEGSYNKLSAQYALNKIKLNQLSQAERETTESGKKLVQETAEIYQQMLKFQESTGNFGVSVGSYAKSLYGLNFSVSQVVRELPAAVLSLNTFFLGISNNIPMLLDDIKKLKLQNEILKKQGKETVNVTNTIVKSLLSWNTAVVILLTVLSGFGNKIAEWLSNINKAKKAIISTKDALKNIAKELKETNNDYGRNIVSLKQLREEWKNLKTTAEKNQWIKDNKTEFDKLGVGVTNVTDAENIFVKNTEAVIKALQARAKAAAAQKLAAEQYEKALLARNEAEKKGVGTIDENGNFIVSDEAKKQMEAADEMRAKAMGPYSPGLGGVNAGALSASTAASVEKAKALAEEAKAAEKTGDAYFNLAAGYEAAAKAELEAAGIDEPHKTGDKKGREPRDLTSTINQNSIKLQKEYEKSITELQRDEYAKRRKEAADQIQNENNKLREMYRKNEEYVKNIEGDYKELTEEQKEQIAQQQKWIVDTVANNLKLLDYQIQQIQKEQQIGSIQTKREAVGTGGINAATSAAKAGKSLVTTQMPITQNVSVIESSLVEERRLVEENLDLEYALIIDANRRLIAAGDEYARSEEEILIELNKKKLAIWSEYDKKILDLRKSDIENELAVVKKGSEEELQLLLELNENARLAALAENAAKPANERVSTDSINAKFNKSKLTTMGQFQMERFDEQQALDEATFNLTEHNETQITKFKLEQEKARWEEQIRLAEAGSLDWSQTQIDTAKATVMGIDKEIDKVDDIISSIGEKGIGGTLLSKLGFDDKAIDAFQSAVDTVISNLSDIMDAEIELAEQAVEAAQERVDAAQSAYDAEVEARNNGYANNVASAKKELEQEKKNQRDKQRLLEEAERRKERLDAMTQASSLITASANIWESLTQIPIIGHALAIAAIASMWTSFAVAKVKAKQVTSQSQEYGEGGIEFLEGGSHASGNDIDLGTNNSKGKRMRAEGGEALAIINKKRTRKYRKVLPSIVDSLNKGTFEDKYMNAFAEASNMGLSINANNIDLSKIENDVRNIRKQNETKYFVMPNGSIMIQHKNVKRIIRN